MEEHEKGNEAPADSEGLSMDDDDEPTVKGVLGNTAGMSTHGYTQLKHLYMKFYDLFAS